MDWGLLLASLLIVTVALAAPGMVGAKTMATEHITFGAT
jgi:hypothetical protein